MGSDAHTQRRGVGTPLSSQVDRMEGGGVGEEMLVSYEFLCGVQDQNQRQHQDEVVDVVETLAAWGWDSFRWSE